MENSYQPVSAAEKLGKSEPALEAFLGRSYGAQILPLHRRGTERVSGGTWPQTFVAMTTLLLGSATILKFIFPLKRKKNTPTHIPNKIITAVQRQPRALPAPPAPHPPTHLPAASAHGRARPAQPPGLRALRRRPVRRSAPPQPVSPGGAARPPPRPQPQHPRP